MAIAKCPISPSGRACPAEPVWTNLLQGRIKYHLAPASQTKKGKGPLFIPSRSQFPRFLALLNRM